MAGLFLCILIDEVACLHVEKNILVEASYLDIEDNAVAYKMVDRRDRLQNDATEREEVGQKKG